jgi:DcmR-like sensory protein
MRQSWGDFLKGACTHSHGVQVYADAVDLADSVAAYLVAGFERDQPAMLVATPEHMSLFAERLGARGWELRDTESAGLLVVADAEETLAGIIGPHGLDRGKFERAVADMLDRIQGGPGVQARVFGEMVDVLSRRGDADIADELERLWNDVARAQQISLLCGYRLDIFDPQTQLETLPHICREHSHVLPARNYPRFARAVDSALREVLGPNHAATVYVLVSREVGHDQVPLAQSILMWVCQNLPTRSSQILASARAHYVRPAA